MVLHPSSVQIWARRIPPSPHPLCKLWSHFLLHEMLFFMALGIWDLNNEAPPTPGPTVTMLMLCVIHDRTYCLLHYIYWVYCGISRLKVHEGLYYRFPKLTLILLSSAKPLTKLSLTYSVGQEEEAQVYLLYTVVVGSFQYELGC